MKIKLVGFSEVLKMVQWPTSMADADLSPVTVDKIRLSYAQFMIEEWTDRELVILIDSRMGTQMPLNQGRGWVVSVEDIVTLIVGRSCWMAGLDSGLLISQIFRDLVPVVGRWIRGAATPPCIAGDDYHSCPVEDKQTATIYSAVAAVPCPLFMTFNQSVTDGVPKDKKVWHRSRPIVGTERWTYDATMPVVRSRFIDQKNAYADVWGRNPWTGERQ